MRRRAGPGAAPARRSRGIAAAAPHRAQGGHSMTTTPRITELGHPLWLLYGGIAPRATAIRPAEADGVSRQCQDVQCDPASAPTPNETVPSRRISFTRSISQLR